VPPAGFWPLGIVGVGLLGSLLAGRRARTRALIGFLGGMGLYGVTIYWFTEFNFIGGVVSMMIESAFLAGAAALTPPGRGRQIGWIGALVLQDWVRTYIPFGGVPLGGIPIGQGQGPLAPAARIGGDLLVTGVVALLGVALEGLIRALVAARAKQAVTGGWRTATFPVVAAAVAAALVVAGRVAPSGHQVGTMRVAAVQGGGRRGLRAIHSSAEVVFQAQLAASRLVTQPVDLLLWPEDVIALDNPIAGTAIATEVGQVAVSHHAALLAGVTEDVGATKFRNAEVVWDPEGQITGRYDKVHRVPFGEYVPLRGFIKHFVSLSVIPRDAIAGTGTGEVSTAEVATDRLRAWETGRAVVMAAPTGWSAVLDSRGRLLQRSRLGAQQVLVATVPRRVGLTPYGTWGDLPVVLAAALALAAGWILALATAPPPHRSPSGASEDGHPTARS